jgi:hypothetical protein
MAQASVARWEGARLRSGGCGFESRRWLFRCGRVRFGKVWSGVVWSGTVW